MMRGLMWAVCVLTMACGGGESTSGGGGATSSAVAQSGDARTLTVAKAIRANPSDADAILSQNGMTAAEFESEMYAIAKDPARAQAFSAGL